MAYETRISAPPLPDGKPQEKPNGALLPSGGFKISALFSPEVKDKIPKEKETPEEFLAGIKAQVAEKMDKEAKAKAEEEAKKKPAEERAATPYEEPQQPPQPKVKAEIKKALPEPAAKPYESTGDISSRSAADYKAGLHIMQSQISNAVNDYLKNTHYKKEHIKNFDVDLDGRCNLENQGVLGKKMQANPESFTKFGDVSKLDADKRYIICVTNEGKDRSIVCVTDLLHKEQITKSDMEVLHHLAIGTITGQAASLSYATIQHSAQNTFNKDNTPINKANLDAQALKVDDVKAEILKRIPDEANQAMISHWWNAGVEDAKIKLKGKEVKRGETVQDLYEPLMNQDVETVNCDKPPKSEAKITQGNVEAHDLFNLTAPKIATNFNKQTALQQA